jgi:vitamin B12 transporter
MRFAGIILLLILTISSTVAQDMAPDTTLNLDAVNIYSARLSRFAKGQEVKTMDSLSRTGYPGASLAELINSVSSAYIRNYGPGTLSTLSFRGTSANHAALLWNGVRVSQPNIGYVDLSLVQQIYFNNISILYGGASSMFGSGSIGGGIHLENNPLFDQKSVNADLALSGGSFNFYGLESVVRVIRKGIYSRTAISLNDSRNDFPYRDLDGSGKKLPHGAVLRSGIMQDIAFKLSGNQYLMVSEWFQYADREIPPTMTESSSEATQLDRSWRTMLIWKDFSEKYSLEGKLAYFNEFTRYDDPPAEIYSTIKSQSLVGSFESTFDTWKNAKLFAGTQFTHEFADLVNYEAPERQDNLAVYASLRQVFPAINWQASLNGRQEFLTGFDSPFLFSAGAEGIIWRIISGRLNVSRNFRAPTFNERFWQPGGNPDIEPEESWNEEAGIKAEKQYEGALMNLELTFYNSNVSNWILWLPGDGFWSVENAQKVWSRGMELSGTQSLKIKSLGLTFVESYSYTKSTNEEKLSDLDASYKKQLIYTPLHKLTFKAGGILKGYNLAFRGNFTGPVYTSKDNLESLPSYFLLDIIFSKTIFSEKKCPVTILINLNNILNVDYQVVPFRPMPGFNGMMTVKIGFRNKMASSQSPFRFVAL